MSNPFVEGETVTVATGRVGGLTESPESEHAIKKAMVAEYNMNLVALRYCMVRDMWVSRFVVVRPAGAAARPRVPVAKETGDPRLAAAYSEIARFAPPV
jgi:hypothetical protein